MRIALVVIDCLRYEYADLFQFDGFQRLNNVVAVSNWTMPTMATMMTGLHPTEHRCCLFPVKDKNVKFLRSVLGSKYRKVEQEMIVDQYEYKAIMEIPIFKLMSEKHGGERVTCTDISGIKHAEKYVEDKDVEFLYLHLKGGHSPYEYSHQQEISHENEPAEIQALSEKLNPFIKKVVKHFDRVVVATDHGELWEDVDSPRDVKINYGHGGEFGLGNLHVPVWTYPDTKLPDGLYDTRLVYNFLMQKPIHIQQLVMSMSPAYMDYNRFAITYLADGKLHCENFSTKEGWAL